MRNNRPHNKNKKRIYRKGKRVYVRFTAQDYVAPLLLAGTIGISLGLRTGVEFRTNLVAEALESAPAKSVIIEKEVEKIVEVAIEPDYSEKQETLAYIVEIFGDHADKAIWLSKCESGLRRDAINKSNRNGTVDHGLFQINSVHTKRFGTDFHSDWRENVRVAKQIFDEQGFRPWVCATKIGEKNYLGQ